MGTLQYAVINGIVVADVLDEYFRYTIALGVHTCMHLSIRIQHTHLMECFNLH